MLTYERLHRKPHVFKAFTGVTVPEFEALLTKAVPVWTDRAQRRLDRPDRQRAPGGGCKPKLALCEQVLVTLVWLRLDLTTETLGFLFGIDKATVSRYTRAWLPVLRSVGDETLGWPAPPSRQQGKNLAQARAAYPDLFAFIDASEHRLYNAPRSRKPSSGTTPARRNATRARCKSSSTSMASCGRSALRCPAPYTIAPSSSSQAPPR